MFTKLLRRQPGSLRERVTHLANDMVVKDENKTRAWLGIGLMALVTAGMVVYIMRQPGEATDLLEGTDLEDDLTAIEGIGPKTAYALRESGMRRFNQLARMNPDEIRAILSDAGIQNAVPDTWPEQARLAENGEWDRLAGLRAELIGGRRG